MVAMMGDVANDNNLQSEQQMSDDLSFHESVPTRPVNTPTGLMNDSARESEEAYLYWLKERKSADPRGPPYATEARAIAKKTERRWIDIKKEIDQVWKLEQSSGGREHREERLRYLGEDPVYPVDAEAGRALRSMFG